MSDFPRDPPVRADGRCAGCEGPRRFASLRPVYLTPAKADPFCSSTCCRAWYGIPLPPALVPGRRGMIEKRDKSPDRV